MASGSESAEPFSSGSGGSGQDAELDQLLDSALDDFDKAQAPPPCEAAATGGAEKPPLLGDNRLLEGLFQGGVAEEARQEWERAMEELANEEPELLQHFNKLSEAAGRVGTDVASQQEFTSCLKETLSGLAKNADTLQSSGLAGDDLVKALEGLGGLGGPEGEEGAEDGNILPIMQSIMQNLLSKEVLYPSLKEITAKYPDWLESNKASLSPEDYGRYGQQARVMDDICCLFEREGADQESTFDRIMELMQQLQELGQPPKELAGDAPPGFNLDMESLNFPGAPGAGEQCSVM